MVLNKKKEIIFGLMDTEKILNQFLDFFKKEKKIFLFSGEMGSGKTTLIGNLINKILNAKGEFCSPTYSYMNSYSSEDGKEIYHFDLYRLKDLKEIEDLGLIEFIEKKNSYIFIEWPEILINSDFFSAMDNYIYCKIEYSSLLRKRKIILYFS